MLRRVYLLAAAANGDQKASFRVGSQTADLTIQEWTGFIGQWDDRIWKTTEEPIAQRPNAPPGTPVPLTLRLYEIGTGRERWAKDIGSAFTGLSGPTFSRDGKRMYTVTREKDDTVDQGRIWIHNVADGIVEKSFLVPSQIIPSLAGETSDGQLIFAQTNMLARGFS